MFKKTHAERAKRVQRGGKGSKSLISNHLYLMNKTASLCICKLLSSCPVDVKKERREVVLKTNLVPVLWMCYGYAMDVGPRT